MVAPDISWSLVVVLLCSLAIIWRKSPQHLIAWDTVGKKTTLFGRFYSGCKLLWSSKMYGASLRLVWTTYISFERYSVICFWKCIKNRKYPQSLLFIFQIGTIKKNNFLRIFCKCQSCHFSCLVQGARSLITILDPAPLWPSVMNVWHVHSFVATHRNVYEHIQWNCLILVLGFIIFETHKYKWWRDRKYSIVCDLSR